MLSALALARLGEVDSALIFTVVLLLVLGVIESVQACLTHNGW